MLELSLRIAVLLFAASTKKHKDKMMKCWKCAAVLLGFIAVTGCSSLKTAMLPSPQMVRTDFNGVVRITQDAVSASSSFSEDSNMLGLAWSSKTPDLAYVQAREFWISSVSAIAFNINGQIREFDKPFDPKKMSVFERLDTNQKAQFFVVPLSYLRQMQTADVVWLRLTKGKDEFSDSSFGRAKTGAAFTAKLEAFLVSVDSASTGP